MAGGLRVERESGSGFRYFVMGMGCTRSVRVCVCALTISRDRQGHMGRDRDGDGIEGARRKERNEWNDVTYWERRQQRPLPHGYQAAAAEAKGEEYILAYFTTNDEPRLPPSFGREPRLAQN